MRDIESRRSVWHLGVSQYVTEIPVMSRYIANLSRLKSPDIRHGVESNRQLHSLRSNPTH